MEKETILTAPMLGAAYYPEDWDESEQDKDIATMKETGLTCVRIAEFAWHKMEPQEGVFDFAWLHRVIDKLGNAGISVVLGTPSATPPIWLGQKDPSIFRLDEYLLPEPHGGRRHCCSNNETYRKYTACIVERMAQEFGQDTRVVGWQIDNEIYIKDNGCFCETCHRNFQKYLAEKYGTIDELNKRWNLNLFSQWYDSFDQIPMPTRSWQNPHISYEWLAFQAQSHIDFLRMQADILHKYVAVPVSTDLTPQFGVDFEKVAEFCDIMQFNQYYDEANFYRAAMWYDYLRTFKNRPFWNTETSTCWSGGITAYGSVRPDGFCRINSWLPIALGGEASFYWPWRQHWAGHELIHGSVLYASGKPMYMYNEVKETAAGFAKCGDFLSKTSVKTDVAMMLSTQNHLMMMNQRLIDEVAIKGQVEDDLGIYGARFAEFYKVVAEYGTRPDILGTNKALDDYKLLITPYMMTLEIDDLQERITKWVHDGGTWIVGPMSDIRKDIGTHYKEGATGIIETLTGATLVDQVPDTSGSVECSWLDGTPCSTSMWLQLFEIPEDAYPLVTVTGNFSSSLRGKSIVFHKKVGKGNIIVLGTAPCAKDMKRIMDIALKLSNAQHFDVTGTVAVAKREGNGESGYIVVGYSDKPASVTLQGTYTELLTGQTYSNTISVEPYQVLVLKEQ